MQKVEIVLKEWLATTNMVHSNWSVQ